MTRSRKYAAWTAGIVGLGLLLVLHARGHVIRTEWWTCLLWLVPLAFVIAMAKRVWKSPAQAVPALGKTLPAAVLLGCLGLHLFSGGTDHGWFFFFEWPPIKGCGCGLNRGLGLAVYLAGVFWPLFLFRVLKPKAVLIGVLLFAQIACIWKLFEKTGGMAIYRDDHPSFMFRLHEFSRTYPRLINYYPQWNGGQVGYVESVSGTTGLGLFLWPLWRFLPVHVVYTYGLAFAFIVFIPLMTAGSLRMMGARWTAGIIGAVLALGVSSHFFLWLLNYGTVGSCFALTFIIPLAAASYRAVWLGRREKWLAAVMVASAFFLLQWPPGAIVAAPLVLSFLFSARKWTRRKVLFLALCAGVVLLLYARTILLFTGFGGSHMAEVLAEKHKDPDQSFLLLAWDFLAKGWDHLLAHVREGHPLITFLGVLGVFFLPYRGVRRWFAPVILTLALITGWGRELFPKLQISRMALPMFFLSVVPAALMVDRLFRVHERTRRLAFASAMLIAVLVTGVWTVARDYGNENPRSHYITMTPELLDMAAWAREYIPENGRLLFAGHAIHAYGGGHTAYLPVLMGREMIGCDYYAFPLGTREFDMPPGDFRKEKEDIFEYMRLYNATHIITYHDKWITRLRKKPEWYREAAQFRYMTVFEVLREPSMFLEGQGTVRADFNRIDVTLPEPQDEIVLCYNWFDEFRAPAPVELFPYEAKHGVRLLGVRPNGKTDFTIRFKSRL